jgi:hypothetical protein
VQQYASQAHSHVRKLGFWFASPRFDSSKFSPVESNFGASFCTKQSEHISSSLQSHGINSKQKKFLDKNNLKKIIYFLSNQIAKDFVTSVACHPSWNLATQAKKIAATCTLICLALAFTCGKVKRRVKRRVKHRVFVCSIFGLFST